MKEGVKHISQFHLILVFDFFDQNLAMISSRAVLFKPGVKNVRDGKL